LVDILNKANPEVVEPPEEKPEEKPEESLRRNLRMKKQWMSF
jgi:hypothetical protein